MIEFGPGLGRTAEAILQAGPRTYVGVERDPDAAENVATVLGGRGVCISRPASSTGLPDASADVVVEEAMLTMQADRDREAIVAEAYRLLRPGGRYAIHELGLQPDALDAEVAAKVHSALVRSIKVNARPLTVGQWRPARASGARRRHRAHSTDGAAPDPAQPGGRRLARHPSDAHEPGPRRRCSSAGAGNA